MGNDRSLLADHEYNAKKNFDQADFELLKNKKIKKSARSKYFLVLYS